MRRHVGDDEAGVDDRVQPRRARAPTGSRLTTSGRAPPTACVQRCDGVARAVKHKHAAASGSGCCPAGGGIVKLALAYSSMVSNGAHSAACASTCTASCVAPDGSATVLPMPPVAAVGPDGERASSARW